MILQQDSLLATRSEFRIGNWTGQARSLGTNEEESNLYEWNARVQITTWGPRECADKGRLHDYAHKEWQGILRDFYYPRWKHFFGILQDELDGKLPMLPVGNSHVSQKGNPAIEIDWYAMEEPWTLDHTTYSAAPEGDPINTAKRIIKTWERD